MKTKFHVYHSVFQNGPQVSLGIAVLDGSSARFKAKPQASAWLESRSDAFLRDVAKVVRRLVHGLGHTSCWCGSWDEDSGLGVERQ